MVTQINMKFQDDFFDLAKTYAETKGYMSIQELVREALRDKIYADLAVKESYKRVLQSKGANTFDSVKSSKKFMEELKKQL